MKAVVHFRVESLFASIEAQRRPELAGKPVMVAKSFGNTSGMVVSVSPEARAFGAAESMTVRHAGRLCPDAVVVAADYALYRSVSASIMDILSQYSPLLEPDSLDGAWMDVTSSWKLFGGPRLIARESIRQVGEMGFRMSAGIASNKMLAQVASETVSGRVKIVAPGQEREFLSTIPIAQLPGVGDKTTKLLQELGVRVIGQLAAIPEKMLTRQFGIVGDRLHKLACGVDHSQVKALWPPEVINIEHTFPDPLMEPSEVESALGPIADRLALELRSQNRLAETVGLEVVGNEKWEMQNAKCKMGEGLARVERSVSGTPSPKQRDQPPAPNPQPLTQHPTPNTQPPSLWRLKRPVNQAGDLFYALRRLLPMQMWPGTEALGVRVVLSDLTLGAGLQLCLLGDSERRRKLDVLMESVHSRFGDSALTYASALAAGRERVLSRMAL